MSDLLPDGRPAAPEPDPSDRVAYPPAPWAMAGSMWLSLFHLRRDAETEAGPRPAGLYGAAFVSYDEGSVLTYSELLVARPVRDDAGRRRVRITDIWVDSPASLRGGRELWAIPKGLADFDRETVRTGPLERTSWQATLGVHPVAEASIGDTARLAPRLPFRARLDQPALPEGDSPRRSGFAGRARMAPAHARWSFAADGPLAYLRSARPCGTARLAAFTMTFG